MAPQRAYDAVLLDVDGTLVTDRGEILPRTRESLRAAADEGVFVMVVTGRSELSTRPILDELDLGTPAVVFNGAAIWCPSEGRLIEERILSDRTLDRVVRFGEEAGILTVTQCAGAKYALPPKREIERLALHDMKGLEFADGVRLRAERAIRVSLFSDDFASSGDFAREIERHVDQPAYTTHFPLSVLPQHRGSAMHVVDFHPPCRGKAEALRYLWEAHGIPPERTVAVGDATNDVEMLEGAGLGVTLESGMPEVLPFADRVIGSNETEALAELIEELFLDVGAARESSR